MDDEEQLRKLLRFDLGRRGFRVLEAANGREAFELIKREKIDLVLSDVRMPGGDGIELLHNIKTRQKPLPAVILITGYADITLEEAFDAGADAVFSKPFDRNELFAKLIRAVSSRESVWSPAAGWLEADFQIVLEFPELGAALSGDALKIGRGGIFVKPGAALPPPGAKTHFRIQFAKGIPNAIEGDGIVLWVRSNASAALPQGCGIEFVHLSDATRGGVISLIESLNPRAYIPKG